MRAAYAIVNAIACYNSTTTYRVVGVYPSRAAAETEASIVEAIVVPSSPWED